MRRRRTRTARPLSRRWTTAARIAGYAGSTLLVAAAVVVLLLPLIDDRKGAGTAGAQGSPAPASASPGLPQGVPGDPVLPGAPTADARNGGGAAGGREGSGRPAPGQGGGPSIPGPGRASPLTWCPKGTAYYRAAGGGVDVVITTSASGAVRAEMSLRGRAPQSQQATVTARRPHTFRFRGVAPGLVENVKITTVSVGVSMQSCYARAA
ncbi:MAG TPA: hypothetical protein VIL71_11390 [Spirillospora sp.]